MSLFQNIAFMKTDYSGDFGPEYTFFSCGYYLTYNM